MTDTFLALGDRIDAWSQRYLPTFPRVNQSELIEQPWALGSPRYNGLEFFRSHDRPQAMRRAVIVIVYQHGRPNQVFACGAYATNLRVAMAGLGAQSFLRDSGALAPNVRGVAQFHSVLTHI